MGFVTLQNNAAGSSGIQGQVGVSGYRCIQQTPNPSLDVSIGYRRALWIR